jgi:glycosyltransferase involved in cell wall biosynthesis
MKYVCIYSINNPNLGGVWSVVKYSLTELKNHYDVLLVLYALNGFIPQTVSSFLKEENIKYRIIPIHSNNGWLYDIEKLLKINMLKNIIGNESCIIHSHDSYLSGPLLYFLNKSNTYCTFHGALINENNFVGKIRRFVDINVRVRLLRKSKAKIISCDPFSMPILQDYFKKHINISVVANGVPSIDKFNCNYMSKNVFTIGYISRFHPLKRWDLVANAVKELYNEGYPIKAVFAGDGECINDVIEYCSVNSSCCKYIGVIDGDRKKATFRYIDIHVLPTEYPEGLPMIILETMSVGIPTITTNSGSCSFAVRNNFNGFVIKPDITELKERILELYLNQDKFQIMRIRNFKLWNRQFSVGKMVEQYMAVFQNNEHIIK